MTAERKQAINVLQKYTDTESGISKVVAEAHKMAIGALVREGVIRKVIKNAEEEKADAGRQFDREAIDRGAYEKIKETVNNERVEGKTGYMISTGESQEYFGEEYLCSECGERMLESRYCPSCGTKMEGTV